MAIDRAFIRAYDDSRNSAAISAVSDQNVPGIALRQVAVEPAQRPKMVVGRKALQALAANNAAAVPHANFAQAEIVSRADQVELEQAVLGKSDATADQPEIVELSAAPQAPSPRRYRVDRKKTRELGSLTAASPRTADLAFEGPIATISQASMPQEPAALQAGLEVDRIRWPAICEKLVETRHQDLRTVAEKIEEQAAAGRQCIAVASAQAREGCTTVLLCLARVLAERNRRVCLIDADFNRPDLAAQLGLSPEAGWDAVAAGEITLADALIESQADGITILPLLSSGTAERRTACPISDALAPLRAAFDLVLIDAGSLATTDRDDSQSAAICQDADACLLVKKEANGPRFVHEACRQLEQQNTPLIGLVENRCRS